MVVDRLIRYDERISDNEKAIAEEVKRKYELDVLKYDRSVYEHQLKRCIIQCSSMYAYFKSKLHETNKRIEELELQGV